MDDSYLSLLNEIGAEPLPTEMMLEGDGMYQQIAHIYQQHVDAFREALLPSMKQIHISMFYGTRFNAIAATDRKGENSIIGFNHALLLLLFDITHSLLARNDVLIGFGEPNLERSDTYTFTTDLSTQIQGNESFDVTLPQAMPRCPERLLAARALFAVALDFVFLHELSHILGGHTRHPIVRGFAEGMFNATTSKSISASERACLFHAFEADADWFAFRLLISMSHNNQALLPAFGERDWTLEQRLSWASIGTLLVLYFSDTVGKHWDICLNRTHPHPLVRQITLRDFFLEGIGEFEEQTKYEPLFDAALKEVQKLEQLNLVPHCLSRVNDQIHNDVQDWISEVVEKQQSLQKGLRAQGLDARMMEGINVN
ncbi:hypothetical protein [Cerasicoccus frondis]|uniref:hypothetical protein n=1 Tax=Cerasicoccus frondis TaxID=490090 RepID=UPI00285254BB|nr:hypothetical protein [Cerasicoccus frondis]